MPEKYDLVDDQNFIIGVTDKKKSHAKALHHRIAVIFVFNEKNELLLHIRADNGYRDHSVGGHVTKGEDVKEAMHREGFEEIGLPQDLPKRHLVTFLSDERFRKTIRHWIALYEAHVHSFKPIIQEEEVKEVYWMSIEDVVADMLHRPEEYATGFINTMNWYLEHKLKDDRRIPLR